MKNADKWMCDKAEETAIEWRVNTAFTEDTWEKHWFGMMVAGRK